MKKVYSTLVILFVMLILISAQCRGAPAEERTDVAAPDIKIMEPFARTSIPNGAVYMHLMNEGGTADRLVSAETDVAEAVELHQTTMENDVMRMAPIDAVELPAGGSATLEPGGMHIMLMGLQKELAIGDTFELTLNFEQSGSQTIQVEVKEGITMDHAMDHNMEEDGMDREE
jgi:copper(I)-binding protein